MNNYYHYFVEGETDEKMISILKTNFQHIHPGKVEIVNVVTNKIKNSMIMKLKKRTIVVLVFDTDRVETSVLKDNINFLIKQRNVISSVICIPQCKNLEDELVYSCNISRIKVLTNSKSNKDFKKDFLHISDQNAVSRLEINGFDIKKLWSRSPDYPYQDIPNRALLIKK